MVTNKHIDQLTWGCFILTKALRSRLESATALNNCWENFTVVLVVLSGSNLN